MDEREKGLGGSILPAKKTHRSQKKGNEGPTPRIFAETGNGHNGFRNRNHLFERQVPNSKGVASSVSRQQQINKEFQSLGP